jgi:N utilization substance protein B
MQALYEVDVTGHGIDEIQLHLGTSRRRELELFFRRARRSARAAVSSITFLARNTNRSDGDDALGQFQAASHKAVNDWIEQPEAEDVDVADAYITFERENIEQQMRKRLSDFRTQAEAAVTESLALPLDGDELDAATRELKADLGEEAAGSPLSELFDRLDLQERNAIRQIETTLNDLEKAATDSLLDMLRHAERLSRGVVDHQETIDPYIAEAAPAFPINQLASIDRAVLRVAMQELLFEPEVPYKAVINEAVDIAKEYGGPNSGRFANGVLRTISDRLQQTKKSATG